jgi:hypothetical protein
VSGSLDRAGRNLRLLGLLACEAFLLGSFLLGSLDELRNDRDVRGRNGHRLLRRRRSRAPWRRDDRARRLDLFLLRLLLRRLVVPHDDVARPGGKLLPAQNRHDHFRLDRRGRGIDLYAERLKLE